MSATERHNVAEEELQIGIAVDALREVPKGGARVEAMVRAWESLGEIERVMFFLQISEEGIRVIERVRARGILSTLLARLAG